MKKIGFIGAYDKTDFLICVAKILTLLNKKVLIIDSTLNQKTRYVIPTISPATAYITSFEGIDVAVGLYTINDFLYYLGETDFESLGYDIALIDIDDPEAINAFDMAVNADNYFVTSFDVYSLKKGVEILSGIRAPMPLTKMLFSNNVSNADNEYLNYLSMGMRVQWNDDIIYIPIDFNDINVMLESEKVSKINIKDLSKDMKMAMTYIINRIGDIGENDIKRVIKQLEKEAGGGFKWQ